MTRITPEHLLTIAEAERFITWIDLQLQASRELESEMISHVQILGVDAARASQSILDQMAAERAFLEGAKTYIKGFDTREARTCPACQTLVHFDTQKWLTVWVDGDQKRRYHRVCAGKEGLL